MTKQQERNRADVITHMCITAEKNGKTGGYIKFYDFANRLHRIETSLSRLACDQCMSPVYDSAKQERLENLAESLISDYIGCKCYTQRDPRGKCIRMYLVDEDNHPWFNNWDGETTGLNW